MAWICVGCSEKHMDNLDTMGFGLCKECMVIAKKKNADKVMLAKARRAQMCRKNNN